MPAGWSSQTFASTDDGSTLGPEQGPVLLAMQPGEKLDLSPSTNPTRTYLTMFKRVEELVEVLKTQTSEDLQDIMDLGKKMAKSHLQRFQKFSQLPPKQACLLFGGDGLSAADFGESDQKWFEAHFRFLSGLYGVVRPYDDVRPVRDVPMNGSLKTKRGNCLIDFWGESISRQLAKDAAAITSGKVKTMLIGAMSDEYWRAVRPELLPGVRLVQCVFEGANGEHSAHARGKLCRYLMKKRICSIEVLRDFDVDDWTFQPIFSNDRRMVWKWSGEVSGAAPEKKKSKDLKDFKDKEKKAFDRDKADDEYQKILNERDGGKPTERESGREKDRGRDKRKDSGPRGRSNSSASASNSATDGERKKMRCRDGSVSRSSRSAERPPERPPARTAARSPSDSRSRSRGRKRSRSRSRSHRGRDSRPKHKRR